MKTKSNSILMRDTNKKAIDAKTQTLLFTALFTVGIIGSWSTGGLFLKEIAIAGIIINVLISIQNLEKGNQQSLISNK